MAAAADIKNDLSEKLQKELKKEELDETTETREDAKDSVVGERCHIQLKQFITTLRIKTLKG